MGDPVLYIQQFIVVAHFSPWRPHLQSNMVVKEALKPAFQITKFITDFQYQDGYVLHSLTKKIREKGCKLAPRIPLNFVTEHK